MAARAPRVLGTVVLVTGSAEFLAERVVGQARAAVVDDDPGADVSELDASALDVGGFAELTSPSLFAASRGVVIRGIDSLPDQMQGPLMAYVGAPAEHVALILLHPGGARGRTLLDKLRRAGVREVKADPPKPWLIAGWVVGEARRLGVALDEPTADALVSSVGGELRAIAAALEQLVSDWPGQRVDVALVRKAFEGRAEIKSFDIADRAVAGDAGAALELLRWALAQRVGPPAITGAFATTVRRLVKLQFAPRGLGDNDLAREVGCSPGQLRRMRAQTRGWDAAGWAAAMIAVAEADAAVKGAAADPGHALEALVLAVVAAGPVGRVPA